MPIISNSPACIECGNALRNKASRKRGTCSNACELNRFERNERDGAKKHTCPACGCNFWTNRKKKYCCQRCANSTIAQRRPVDRGGFGHRLKSAISLGAEDVLSLLREESKIAESGCWEFDCPPSLIYPSVAIDGKMVKVHRISLEAKIGAPLGVQAAHHMCANTRCVNPEHLQPVTYRENTAEMLARNSYIRRIRELEDVIRAIDPTSPVLDRVPMAGV